MRIENYANIPSSGKTNVGDLMNRLNPGDVIRAKVLEITSDEAILKLFDGTVMHAKMLETMNAKAGETVMLTVSSKSEGTLYLESVKNLSQMIEGNPETLNSLLKTLQIKPDALNLQLAAELIKSGAPVTAEYLEQSAALLNSSTGLDAEKAVYMILKGINAAQVSIEMLTKLLEGNLKLGQQLKDIQTLLDQTNAAKADQIGSEVSAQVQRAATQNDQTTGASTSQVVSTTANQSAGTASANQTAAAAASVDNASGNQTINKGDNGSHNQTQTLQAQAAPINSASQEAPIAAHSETASENTAASVIPNTSGNTAASGATSASENTAASGTPDASGTTAASLHEAAAKTSSTAADSASATGSQVLQAFSEDDRASAATASSAGEFSKEGLSLADRFSKLIKTVMDTFVRTDSDRLASELDVNKIKSELYEKLDVLKAAIQSSEGYDSREREGLFLAATRMDDTLKLLNHMNSSNVMYYQIPVSMAGHDTTAELYVMKRQKNKKKIDPHNTVVFISLDTNHIGRIETLLDVKGSNITLNLRTESKLINDFIKGKIKDLYKGLAACGYKLAGIRYAVIDSATPLIQQERLMSGIEDQNYGKVDYRI